MRIRMITGALIALVLLPVLNQAWASPPIRADELRRHVEFLADPALEGRALGTAGIDTAAAYIARRFHEIGLQPAGPGGSYFQPFEAKTKAGKVTARNVVGLLPGGLVGARPYIVLGAHYDHLGTGGEDFRGVVRGSIHPGADDNASGVAGILEIAEYFASAGPLDRTLVFIAFSGEELGLLGSAHFVDHPTLPLEYVLAMLNLDAVGRPDPGEVTLFGTQTATEFDSLLLVANDADLKLMVEGDAIGPSDHTSFALKQIPALHFFGAAHTDYHRPSDTPDKLNYPGMEALVRYTARMVEVLETVQDSLTFREPLASKRPSAHGGRGTHLGIVPDFGGSDEGMAIRGVRMDSPADEAGLQAGDVILRLGDSGIGGIQDLFAALGAHSPGDTVEIEVVRESKRLNLRAVLGESPSEPAHGKPE